GADRAADRPGNTPRLDRGTAPAGSHRSKRSHRRPPNRVPGRRHGRRVRAPAALTSDEPVLARPPGQLVPRRELKLAQDVRDVTLDRLHRKVQARGDLLVHVATRDELEHLAFARRELVELRVAAYAFAGAESVEHEAGKPG